jgi:hypothetical protein
MIRNLLRFFLHRNKNKAKAKQTYDRVKQNANQLTPQDSYSPDVLKAMQTVIRMKEAADKSGAGFVGGFLLPDGKQFIVSNVSESDVGNFYVKNLLNDLKEHAKKSKEEEDSTNV